MAIFKRKLDDEEMPERQSTGLNILCNNLKKTYVKYMTNLGAYIFHYGKFVIIKSFEYTKKASLFTATKTVSLSKKLGNSVVKLLKRVFAKPLAYFSSLKASVSAKKEKDGLFPAIRHCFAYLGKSAWNSKRIVIKTFNYVAPVAAIVFLVSLVTYAKDTKYAISVEYNGKVIGYIEDEGVADEAQKILQERINYVEGDEPITIEPKLSLQKLSSKTEIYDGNELANKLISTSDADIKEAYGIYINDKFHGAVEDDTKIKATLDDILSKYKTGNPTEVVEFVDKIEIKEGLYFDSGIISEDEFIDKLNGNKQVDEYYTIVAGDAPTLIAQKVGIPYSQLKALNPEIETKCFVGQQVLVNRSKPYLSVRVTREEQYDETIPYSTVNVQDPTKYKGQSTVLVNGENGTAHVNAKVSIVDGIEESRTITSRQITKNPVDKKVSVGTKSTGADPQTIAAAGGKMLWPTGGGYNYISNYFRGYAHRGIDIASNGVHLPIYAAQDGTVIQAGWSRSYGNCIKISHGNGVVTLYAHLSKINVPVGTKVSKGDLIGIMGNTGYSFGVHLHFEVQQYGKLLNPLSFLR